eukprot:301551_1
MSLLTQKHKQLQEEWNKLCEANTHATIINYFESHKKDIISSDSPWFLTTLFQKDNVPSVKCILENTDPQQYINLKPYPIFRACSMSSFEMIRLIVSHGVTYNEKQSHLLECLWNNQTLTNTDDIYLCVEFLLDNLNFSLFCDNTIYAFALGEAKMFDPIKMSNLIKSKRSEFGPRLAERPEIGLHAAAEKQNFEYAEYLIQCGAKLHPLYFAKCGYKDPDKNLIKWLLKQDVDINGEIDGSGYYVSNTLYQRLGNDPSKAKVTPLFVCCIAKKYDVMELLLDNGADMNKQCVFEGKTITPLEYMKETFLEKYYEYFRNYTKKNNDSTFFGLNLSLVPNTPCPTNFIFSENDSIRLSELNNELSHKKKQISDLEKELNVKYVELRQLFSEQIKLGNKQESITKWKDVKDIWDQFLCNWKEWNVECFIEYLKRISYVDKSFNEYYVSRDVCKQRIEQYVRQFDEKESVNNENHFKGIYLAQFSKESVRGIGITSNTDVEIVYSSLQKLVKIDQNVHQNEEKNDDGNKSNSEEQKLKDWLTNVVQLPQYIGTFVKNNISLGIMHLLSKDDLKNMGVISVGHQIIILTNAKQNILGNDVNAKEGASETAYI